MTKLFASRKNRKSLVQNALPEIGIFQKPNWAQFRSTHKIVRAIPKRLADTDLHRAKREPTPVKASNDAENFGELFAGAQSSGGGSHAADISRRSAGGLDPLPIPRSASSEISRA